MRSPASPFEEAASVAESTGALDSIPLATETPVQTQSRAATTQRVRNKLTAADLASRGVASFTTPSGNVAEILDPTDNTPLTSFSRASGIGYNGSGEPRQVRYSSPAAAPSVVDPYVDAPQKTDKAGNVYSAPKGLPWKQTGEDAVMKEQLATKARAQLDRESATALAPEYSAARTNLLASQKAAKLSSKKTVAQLNSLGVQTSDELGQPTIDLDNDPETARSHIEDTFNKGYASGPANASPIFGGARYTADATTLRKSIDDRKAAAIAALNAHTQAVAQAQQARSQFDTLHAQRKALEGSRLDTVNAKRTAAGLEPVGIPGLETLSAPSEQTPPSLPSTASLTDGAEQPVDDWADTPTVASPDASTLDAAPFTPEEQPYRTDEAGNVTFDPARLTAGITAAVQAGHIDAEKAAKLLPLAQAAEKAYSDQAKLLANDTVASKLKATGYGAGKGVAFLAGALPAGAIAAEYGSFLGPWGALLAGAAGSVIGGTAASFSADKIVRKLAEQSATIQKFTDAADAHPNYDAAGNFLSFAVGGIPRAGTALLGAGIRAAGRVAGVEAEGLAGRGVNAAATSYETGAGNILNSVQGLSRDAAIRAKNGASQANIAGAIGGRVLGFAAGNAALDTVIKEGMKGLGISDEGQTLSGAAQAALLGAFVSGHNLTVAKYSPEEVGTLLVKAREATARGVDPSTVLSPAEMEAANVAISEINRVKNSGTVPQEPTVSVEQMRSAGQPYGVSAATVEGSASGGTSPQNRQPPVPLGPSPQQTSSVEESPNQLGVETPSVASGGMSAQVVEPTTYAVPRAGPKAGQAIPDLPIPTGESPLTPSAEPPAVASAPNTVTAETGSGAGEQRMTVQQAEAFYGGNPEWTAQMMDASGYVREGDEYVKRPTAGEIIAPEAGDAGDQSPANAPSNGTGDNRAGSTGADGGQTPSSQPPPEVSPEIELKSRELELSAMNERDPFRPLVANRIEQLKAIMAQEQEITAAQTERATNQPTAPAATRSTPAPAQPATPAAEVPGLREIAPSSTSAEPISQPEVPGLAELTRDVAAIANTTPEPEVRPSPAEKAAPPSPTRAESSSTPTAQESASGKETAVAAKGQASEPRGVAMLDIEGPSKDRVLTVGKSIDPSDLYHDPEDPSDYGLENEPHITALYGFTDKNPAPVQRVIEGFGPVKAKLGRVSLFENDGSPYDVVKVDVSGGDIHRLNAKLRKLPHKSDFPDYHPHVTIAYVKKGTGHKYVGEKPFTGSEITFDSATFSDANRSKTKIKLSNEPTTQIQENPTASPGASDQSGTIEARPGNAGVDVEQRPAARARYTQTEVSTPLRKLKRGPLKAAFDMLQTDLVEVGDGPNAFAFSTAPVGDAITVRFNPKELGQWMDVVRENFAGDGDAAADKRAKDWLKAATEEELIHVRQYAFERGGPEFKKTYQAIWNSIPKPSRDAFESVMAGNHKTHAPHLKGAEIERMVIQFRENGTISEALTSNAMQKAFEALKPILDAPQSDVMEDNIVNVMTLAADVAPSDELTAGKPYSESEAAKVLDAARKMPGQAIRDEETHDASVTAAKDAARWRKQEAAHTSYIDRLRASGKATPADEAAHAKSLKAIQRMRDRETDALDALKAMTERKQVAADKVIARQIPGVSELQAGKPKPLSERIKAAMSKPKMTPEEALFMGPVVPSFLKRGFEGSADTLKKIEGLKNEGEKLSEWRDNVDKFVSDSTKPERDFQRSVREDQKRITAAENEVSEYYKFKDGGDNEAADKLLKGMSDDGKAALDAWRKAASDEFDRLTALDYQVRQSDGTKRAIRRAGKDGDFHPRTERADYRDAIQNFAKDPTKAREVIAIMLKDAGERARPGETPRFTTPAQVVEYLKKEWADESDYDMHGSTERARESKLPVALYDYSYDARVKYLVRSAERRAQVAAFGQEGRLDKDNFWNKAIARSTEPSGAAYLASVRDAVYGVTRKGAIHNLMAGLNAIATPSQLGNPITIGVNLASGLTFTGSDLGLSPSFRALKEMFSNYDKARHESEDIGAINQDLMSLYRDAEQYSSSTVQKIHKVGAAVLKYTGYNKSEEWVRVHATLAGKYFARDAKAAYKNNPNSRTSKLYTAKLKRHGIKPEKFYAEKEEGPETKKFIRAEIRDVQGGYRVDQVQPELESEAGKFFLKYQKWGFQQTRHFIRNVIKPALGKDGPADMKPLLRYVLMGIGLGLGVTALKEAIFGTPDKTASLDEIGKTWNEDQRRATALLAQKLWSAQMAAGLYGTVSNYVQTLGDVTERSRFKNPLEPPGVSSITNAGEQILRLIEQKKLTPADLDDYLRSQISLYRTGKQAAARLAAETGAPVLKNEQSRQDLSWLGTVTRRFAAEVGIEASRTALGRVAKTEQSPTKTELLNALRTGDPDAAKQALGTLLASKDTAAANKQQLESIKSSVRASQPIKVGAASEARRVLFSDWAQKRLPADELARVQRIDKTYRDTAERIGLFRSGTVTPKALDAARQKLGLAVK